MNVDFVLTGCTPILFHADDLDANDKLVAWRKDPENQVHRKAGDDRVPPWTWKTYLYSDGENVAWPSDNIMVCLRQAGAKVTLKGNKTYKELTQSGLLIFEEYCPFLCCGDSIPMDKIVKVTSLDQYAKQAEAVEGLGFRLFAKRAKIGTSKHIRVRARFDQWSVSGRIQILTPDISYDVLQQIFEIAGRCGLGDWRPACKTPGRFGMFRAALKKAK